MTIPEKALQWAIGIANDQSHGYSQANRWGPDYDCSSLAISAYKQAGVNTGSATYTGNMSDLLNHGFKDVTNSVNLATGNGLQPGDIIYYHKSGNIGHTALFAGANKIVHARGQSYGSSRTGDQGTEIAVTPYYRGSFDRVYRYVGGETAPAPAPATVEMCPISVNLPLIMYGSKGSAVRVWQAIIGVETDGEFGQETKLATLGFQTNHDLKADGEVGKKTWTAGLSELTYT